MFTWNDQTKIKKTDEEIAFEITDLLFTGLDARKVEKTIVKELREKRIETIDWLIDECRDKILELKLDDRDSKAVKKLTDILGILAKYKSDIENGNIPNPFKFHRDNDDPWIVPLICMSITIWYVLWILRG